MARILRGDIWWADLNPAGSRASWHSSRADHQQRRFQSAVGNGHCDGDYGSGTQGGLPIESGDYFDQVAQAFVGQNQSGSHAVRGSVEQGLATLAMRNWIRLLKG